MTTTTDLAATQTHDEPACLTHPDGTRRRAFLGVAAAVGAVCAGCSSSKSSSASTGSTTSAASSSAGGGAGSSSAASSSSDTGSASPSSSSGSSGSTGSAALAAASAVPVGGGTVLTDQKIVVTQPTAGTFKAFTAVCTHQGCVVGTVESGMIVCPCHGSRFHIADGSVANGPAAQPLTPVAVKVVNGQIVQA